MKKMLLYLMLVMVLAGCQLPEWLPGAQYVAWTPEAKLAAARETFNTTVDILTTLRIQGKFTKAEGEQIGIWLHLGQRPLDRWQAAVNLGQDTKGVEAEMRGLTRELEAARIAAERRSP